MMVYEMWVLVSQDYKSGECKIGMGKGKHYKGESEKSNNAPKMRKAWVKDWQVRW